MIVNFNNKPCLILESFKRKQNNSRSTSKNLFVALSTNKKIIIFPDLDDTKNCLLYHKFLPESYTEILESFNKINNSKTIWNKYLNFPIKFVKV